MHTQTHDSKASIDVSTDRPARQKSMQPKVDEEAARGAGGLHAALESPPQRGVSVLIADSFLAWQERRFVARAAKELLALYRSVSSIHPDWTRRKLYQQVVMRRTGCDPAAADIILEAARDSFAQWPSSRELNLCDVAHYLSVTEFLAIHRGKRWIHSSLTPVVASQVPHELCLERAAT